MLINEANFFAYLSRLKCFEQYPKVAVGVSGGPDSIALVYLIQKWIKSKKGNLHALIFDHRIRSNSSQESQQVKEILNGLQFVNCGWIWHFNGFDKEQRNNLMKQVWDLFKDNYEVK